MNVFDAIKGTILNVPKDISSGFKSLTNRDVISPDKNGDTDDEEYFVEQQGINYDAGAELLNKFQGEWSELHQKSEENAKKAKTVDGIVTDLFLYLERQNDAVNQFLMEIGSLPQLLTNLQKVTEKIDDLESQFELLESDLVVLEDVCEEQDLRKNRQHHQYQLETYRQRRTAELEQAKVQLAKQHAVKVQKYELHLQKTLRERQQAFEASFREEVQHYKQYGHVSPFIKRKPSNVESTGAMLDSFVPEEDKSELDDFLKTESSQDESQDHEIVSAESNVEQISSRVDTLELNNPPSALGATEDTANVDIPTATPTDPTLKEEQTNDEANEEAADDRTPTDDTPTTVDGEQNHTKVNCDKTDS